MGMFRFQEARYLNRSVYRPASRQANFCLSEAHWFRVRLGTQNPDYSVSYKTLVDSDSNTDQRQATELLPCFDVPARRTP
jgi:hypothetical protein